MHVYEAEQVATGARPVSYESHTCWYGVRQPHLRQRKVQGAAALPNLCGARGALYEVARTLARCRMYLCETHAKAMKDQGYAVQLVPLDEQRAPRDNTNDAAPN